MKKLISLLILINLVLGGLLWFFNQQHIVVNYYVDKITAPTYIVIFIAVGYGLLLGLILLMLLFLRMHIKHCSLRKELQQKEKSLQDATQFNNN